jgi:uncharacterized membrane protein
MVQINPALLEIFQRPVFVLIPPQIFKSTAGQIAQAERFDHFNAFVSAFAIMIRMINRIPAVWNTIMRRRLSVISPIINMPATSTL